MKKMKNLKISRPKNHKHSFKTGREKHGFIYIVNGMLLESFKKNAKPILCGTQKVK